MALDLYVGGFSRYYSREWENVVQRMARESGTRYVQVSPGGPQQPPDWDEVSKAVTNWRDAINAGLGSNLDEPLAWDESRQAPYFTDRPGYEPYGALMVWAAHAEAGSTPPDHYKQPWYEDAAFLEYGNQEKAKKYRALTAGLWLPGRFDFSFDFQDLVSQQVHITSNQRLALVLNDLNEQTFQLSEAELSGSIIAQPDGNTLREIAMFAFLIFKQLCDESITHHLPILLDT